jgi:hypothetical protein
LMTPRIAWSTWNVILVVGTLFEEVAVSTETTVPAKMYPDWRVILRKLDSLDGSGCGSAADQEIPVSSAGMASA